ncbi:MAG: prolipoprotein diacylglyceryl transferase, partial [Proteobacteria bacterium]|nr:prolipoprotein diacylglyceryl transferase [Pseudomonadota bacterium]
MVYYPAIDPIIFSLGPLAIRWYGLSYVLGFASFWWLGLW